MASDNELVWSDNSVSEDPMNHPDVVERRPATDLTEETRRKLENQGIPREEQNDDLTILKARYGLDKRRSIHGVDVSNLGTDKPTKEMVLKQIRVIMNNLTDEGVVIYYIGHGKRGTGDWCFEDGFITFRELASLYLQQFRGHVMTLVSDCSHSGSWVREGMAFLDEQKVGPCGHSARDKKILIKVYSSCFSSQVPRKLSFSIHGCKNDKNTGDIMFNENFKELADSQHVIKQDFTLVRCGQKSIDDQCLCLPQANWQTWSTFKRIYTIPDEDRGRKAWHIVLLVDDDNTILLFREKTASGTKTLNVEDYGEILKSGLGEGPSEEEKRSAMKKYRQE